MAKEIKPVYPWHKTEEDLKDDLKEGVNITDDMKESGLDDETIDNFKNHVEEAIHNE